MLKLKLRHLLPVALLPSLIAGLGALCGMLSTTGAMAAPASVKPVPQNGPRTFAYFASPNAVYSIRQLPDGSLTALQPKGVPAGDGAYYIAVHPSRNFLYVSNRPTLFGTANTISQFRIKADGTLTALNPPSVAGGSFNSDITVSGDGKFLYLGDNYTGEIIGYAIAKDGRLSCLRGKRAQTGGHPVTLSVDNSGHFLYVLTNNRGEPIDGYPGIAQFRITSNGALQPLTPALVHEGMRKSSIHLFVDRTQPYVFVSNHYGVSVYTVTKSGTLAVVNASSMDAFEPGNAPTVPISQFDVDTTYRVLVGIGSEDPNYQGSTDDITTWVLDTKGALTHQKSVFIGNDGLLYKASQDIPNGKVAFLISLTVDTEKHLVYAFDYQTARIFRYRITVDGELQLIVPYFTAPCDIDGFPDTQHLILVNKP